MPQHRALVKGIARRFAARAAVACAVLSVFACAGLRTRGASPRGTGTDVTVRDFCSAFGRRTGTGPTLLFTEDALVRFPGLGIVLQGRAALRDLFDYARVANARLDVLETGSNGDTVNARLEETNDWFELLGVPRAAYRARFVLDGTRIASATISLAPETKDEFGTRLAAFVTWLKDEDRAALDRILPGGRLAFSEGNARALIALLRRWRDIR